MLKITPRILLAALFASVVISVVSWCWLVLDRFDLAAPWTDLPYGLWHTFDYPSLQLIALQALALGFVPMGVALFMLRDSTGADERVLRGAKLATAQELARRTRIKWWRRKADGKQVQIAGVPIPPDCEPVHILVPGGTGTGKSTAADEVTVTALARGDRLIIIDPNGLSLGRFGKKGDRVLNPFDKRSPSWSPFEEVRHPYDFEKVARSLVPDSADAHDQTWRGFGRQLLAETMRAMMMVGDKSTGRLLYLLNAAPAEELGRLLAGSAAAGQFAPGAEKALAGTRFGLSSHLSALQYLGSGGFSLRDWLENERGNLFITWREDMLPALRPLISAWTDILLTAVLTLPTTNPRPLWLLLDELGSLERLSSLEAALTKGRKHGLRVLAGLQSTAQLEAIYGHANARTLRSCFRNVLALGCSPADAETAKAIADGLGQVEVERMVTTYNEGQYRGTSSRSLQRSIESLVLPDGLIGLPQLHGYLKLAGGYPTARVQLRHRNCPIRINPFEER